MFGLCTCVCVCVSVISITQKQIAAETSNQIKFSILHLYHVQILLETFYKDWKKTVYMDPQNNYNTLWAMDGILC